MADLTIPAFIRGELISDGLVAYAGRNGRGTFLAPGPDILAGRLPLRQGSKLADLYGITLGEILGYLEDLGRRLNFDDNPHWQAAFEHSLPFSDMTAPVLRAAYQAVSFGFERGHLLEQIEQNVGSAYLEGWVDHELQDGRILSVRAMGARALHIVAGNHPGVSTSSVIRNAITRSDAIIKIPSNDPLTALAVAQTMLEMAPDHPLTRHISTAYWKGGDEAFESRLYNPTNIEKLVAWGGFASVKHVTRYIQPGLELISLDPKQSATIIGSEAFAGDEILDQVALRAAADIGTFNQLGCVNARVIYLLCGTDDEGIAKARRLGEQIYRHLVNLPSAISTKAKRFDPDLRENLRALRIDPEWYEAIGGEEDEGAIVVSKIPEPVDWSPSLNDRVANIVPLDSVDEVVTMINSYTQTVGIYPDSLKRRLRDLLPLHGAQRLVSLGYAPAGTEAGPHDAIEPLRRMCKWIADETCDPAVVTPIWEAMASLSKN